jgi:hypothetical protein
VLAAAASNPGTGPGCDRSTGPKEDGTGIGGFVPLPAVLPPFPRFDELKEGARGRAPEATAFSISELPAPEAPYRATSKS